MLWVVEVTRAHGHLLLLLLREVLKLLVLGHGAHPLLHVWLYVLIQHINLHLLLLLQVISLLRGS